MGDRGFVLERIRNGVSDLVSDVQVVDIFEVGEGNSSGHTSLDGYVHEELPIDLIETFVNVDRGPSNKLLREACKFHLKGGGHPRINGPFARDASINGFVIPRFGPWCEGLVSISPPFTIPV